LLGAVAKDAVVTFRVVQTITHGRKANILRDQSGIIRRHASVGLLASISDDNRCINRSLPSVHNGLSLF
jgi:hypothetical protein